MSSYQILVNVTANTETRLYTGEVTAWELSQVSAIRGDMLQVVEVQYELEQDGFRRIPGTMSNEPNFVRREISRRVVREWKHGRK